MFLVSLAAKTALAATMSLSGHGYVTVAPGDTLAAIAAANGTTWQAVYAANRAVIGPDPNIVYAGERLVLPGGGAVQTAAQVTAQPVGDGDNDADDSGQAASAATAEAPAPTPARQSVSSSSVSSSSGSAGGGSGNIPPSFFSCVHFRESTNGQMSNNQFGIMPSTWSAYGFPGSPYSAPYSLQVQAFQRIYASVGASAWAPYDGC